jgi:predicted PurR-regulated permease PerM
VKEAARSAASFFIALLPPFYHLFLALFVVFLLLRIPEKLLQQICRFFGCFLVDASQTLQESLTIYSAQLIDNQLALSFLKLTGDACR